MSWQIFLSGLVLNICNTAYGGVLCGLCLLFSLQIRISFHILKLPQSFRKTKYDVFCGTHYLKIAFLVQQKWLFIGIWSHVVIILTYIFGIVHFLRPKKNHYVLKAGYLYVFKLNKERGVYTLVDQFGRVKSPSHGLIN